MKNKHSHKNSKMVQGHQARKRFGQNFLSEPYYIQRIVDSIAPSANDTMVEIGPGLGAITELLIDKVNTLDVVELDRDLLPKIEQKFGHNPHFSIHHSDALKFDFSQLATERLTHQENKQKESNGNSGIRIVGNLPYNISTPLLFHLLNSKQKIEDMFFMLQKEVVERICAKPACKDYGRLSVMCQFHCDVEMLFIVPPGAFRPAPKVDSAIVRLKPKQAAARTTSVETATLNTLVTTAFNQRRKTLRNNLKKLIPSDVIQSLSIDPSVRPEILSLDEYIKLAEWLEQQDKLEHQSK